MQTIIKTVGLLLDLLLTVLPYLLGKAKGKEEILVEEQAKVLDEISVKKQLELDFNSNPSVASGLRERWKR